MVFIMENGKRNQGISFLMVVGIIFIVIAGTIFISKAWGYLPLYGKQFIMILSAAGLFAGASKLSANGVMVKTEAALYYLAASFLGLFTLSLFGGIIKTEGVIRVIGPTAYWNEKAILASGVVMLLSAGIRFVKIRRVFDFTLLALLADWVVFWFMVSMRFDEFGFCFMSAVLLTAYAAADFLRYIWADGVKNAPQVFYVLYIIHIVDFVFCNLNLINTDNEFVLKAGLFVMSVFMVCITLLYQIMRKNTVFSVLNSISIYWFLITGVSFINELFSDGKLRLWDNETKTFIMFCACAVCMVIFARAEMIWITLIWGMLMPFIQICGYGGYYLIFFYVRHEPSAYIPFTGVLVLALVILAVRKYYEGRIDEEIIKQYGMAALMQIIVMCVMFYASKQPFLVKGIYSLLMLQSLTISFIIKRKMGRTVFRIFSLMFGEMFIFACVNDWFPVNYRIEVCCSFVMAGVFLSGEIVNKRGKAMKNYQFISICLNLVVMLSSAIIYGGIGNALILGVTGAVMLFLAAMLNSYRYVVASSVVLILLAFYLTRSFWFEIEWWVYLFVAGVALVALAVKKEKKSKKQG